MKKLFLVLILGVCVRLLRCGNSPRGPGEPRGTNDPCTSGSILWC